jgi:N-methylhydantoinase B
VCNVPVRVTITICFAGHDPRHDGAPYFYIDATPGGWGAHARGDGEDGLMSAVNGSIKLQPAEVFEAKYPIRVTEYALRPDSEGPGRLRSGFGVRRAFELGADASLYLWMERSATPAWGLFGGESAEARGCASPAARTGTTSKPTACRCAPATR